MHLWEISLSDSDEWWVLARWSRSGHLEDVLEEFTAWLTSSEFVVSCVSMFLCTYCCKHASVVSF